MQIGNKSLDKMFEEIYLPIVRECGLRLFRVDKDNEGDLIKKTIDKYIKEAEIIIADLTNERPSCYHEVGYAYGLRKYMNVIVTVREDHLPASDNFDSKGPKIHFDLNDYPIITWKPNDIENFRRELKNEIQRRLRTIEGKRKIGKKYPKNDNHWFLEHQEEALKSLSGFENQGYVEINISLDNFDRTLRQDEIIDSIKELKPIKEGFPFNEAIELDFSEEFRWKHLHREISKNIIIKENNMLIYWAIRRDLKFFLLNSFFEDIKNKEILYADIRIYRLVNSLLFIQRFYNKLKIPNDTILIIKVIHGNLKEYKLLTPWQREMNIIKNPWITTENNITEDVKIMLKNIDSDLTRIVEDLISQLFIVYDAADYLKNIPETVSNHMKKKILN